MCHYKVTSELWIVSFVLKIYADITTMMHCYDIKQLASGVLKIPTFVITDNFTQC